MRFFSAGPFTLFFSLVSLGQKLFGSPHYRRKATTSGAFNNTCISMLECSSHATIKGGLPGA